MREFEGLTGPFSQDRASMLFQCFEWAGELGKGSLSARALNRNPGFGVGSGSGLAVPYKEESFDFNFESLNVNSAGYWGSIMFFCKIYCIARPDPHNPDLTPTTAPDGPRSLPYGGHHRKGKTLDVYRKRPPAFHGRNPHTAGAETHALIRWKICRPFLCLDYPSIPHLAKQ